MAKPSGHIARFRFQMAKAAFFGINSWSRARDLCRDQGSEASRPMDSDRPSAKFEPWLHLLTRTRATSIWPASESRPPPRSANTPRAWSPCKPARCLAWSMPGGGPWGPRVLQVGPGMGPGMGPGGPAPDLLDLSDSIDLICRFDLKITKHEWDRAGAGA